MKFHETTLCLLVAASAAILESAPSARRPNILIAITPSEFSVDRRILGAP